MKLTKPAQAMELRSLSLVFDGLVEGRWRPTEAQHGDRGTATSGGSRSMYTQPDSL
jgi:hypothetical protein